MFKRSCLLFFITAFCFLMAFGHTLQESNFVSSLVSRVRETEPREIREYRTSCIREPGCSWKCPDDVPALCQCLCGSQKRKKTSSKSRRVMA
ncbi:uncharacterized protein CDAR_581681 [Caerostris darwini]|uniref:Uncharacterized protein n=1 Tax=Caerostris darwini TaxID=1538125 RepID=A0AAV4X8T9_9ARAC|nr:uncharacterized protein CDAR_581681 [Caerostris darwini]